MFRTNALVDRLSPPFDGDDDRSLIENCCIKEAKQPWDWGQPPKKTRRAVRVPVMFTLQMFALATAYRLRGEQEDAGGESVGWQRWRRQILKRTRAEVIVFAQACDGLFHMAESSLLVGGKLQDVTRYRPTPRQPREIRARSAGLSFSPNFSINKQSLDRTRHSHDTIRLKRPSDHGMLYTRRRKDQSQ